VIMCLVILATASGSFAQRTAVLTPDNTGQSEAFASRLESELDGKLQLLDDALARSAFGSFELENPFNLTTDDGKKIAAAIGCDFFVLVRSSTVRRSSSERPEYYEANAAIFVVSGRTGRLIWFDLIRSETSKPEAATRQLMDLVTAAASKVTEKIGSAARAELNEPPRPHLEEVPEPNTPAARNFRAPIPYRRIKPTYTDDAAYYDIRPTVDIEVDLNGDGSIAATRIVRWAGYGLDESVEKAVRTMNWRPAERNGKNLPMRFLLRYNFKRIEKDDLP
jgi:TonB family protein